MNSRTGVVTALALTIIGTLYLVHTPSSSISTMASQSAPASSNGVPGLQFKLSQISKDPPSLLVTLKNTNPTSTFTILKWSTPLDPQATNLGVFKLVNADTGDELNTDIIKIGRKMPPSREDLQEIAPNTEHAVEVVLDKPWMPETKPAKYKVKVEGVFHGVWEKLAADVQGHELEDYTNGVFENSPFVSEQVLLVVE